MAGKKAKEVQRVDPAAEGAAPLHRIYGMPGHLIRRSHQIAVAIFMDCTKAYNLTPVQYGTLTVAESYPGIDQRTLAGMVAFDRSTIGDVIQRLEQRGLLTRQEGEDRRTKLVTLTEEGGRVLAAMDELVLEAQLRILAPLSDGEQVILMFLLSKLVDLSNDMSPTPLKSTGADGDTHHLMRGFLRSTFIREVGPQDIPDDVPPPPRRKRKA